MDKRIRLEGGTPGPRPEHRRDTYFIACYSPKNKLRVIKIGTCARNMAVYRLRVLQTGSVDRLKLLAVYSGNVERKLHRLFADSRLRKNSEYFEPTKELLQLIDKLSQITRDLSRIETTAEPQVAA